MRPAYAMSMLLVIPIVLFAAPAYAGKFVIERVWTPTESDEQTTKARAGASAIFEGAVEPGDRTWALEANLLVDGQKYYSSTGGKSGTSVSTGMRITCSDLNCGASHQFTNCPAKSYAGYGVVAIYNNWSPKTDREDDFMRLTTCTPPTSSPSPGGGTCLYNEPDQDGCCQGTCTPILLDLGGAGFELSGVEPPVVFDIDADGVPDSISWTRLGGDEAFLALDRNGNGAIDSGSELFGAATEQPPSDDPNGFLALAVFDTPEAGGNGDGRITVDDAVFSRLVLWNDADRDGTSSPSELTSLGDHGVIELSIEHVTSERRDRYGNRFRWTGRARTTERRPITASDVVFVSAPGQSPPR